MNSPVAPRQPFLPLAAAAALGILLAEWTRLPLFLLCTILLLGALALCWRPSSLGIFLLVALFFYALHLSQRTESPGLRLAQELGARPRPVVVLGEVVSEAKSDARGYSNFLLRLSAIEISGRRENCRATVSVRWKGEAELGDELRLTALAETIPPSRNPGVFDARAALARRDVFNSLFARYRENGVIVRPAAGSFFPRLAANARDWMETTLTRGLENSPDVCALIRGMALGVRHETQEDVEEPFQQTGTLHLFAVAGLHVGIIAQLLWILARLVRLPRKAAAAFIIPFLFFYSQVTGGHVSSERAATMAAVLLGGIFFGRRVFALNSLAAAAVLILALDTNQLFASGFQLSFAVVGAIILLQNALFEPIARIAAPDPFLPRNLVRPSRRAGENVLRWAGRGISVSAAAWVGSLLLIAWYFYLVTPISLLANLTIVPVAFFILATAMLSLLTAPFSVWLSLVFNNANWSLSQLILALVQIFAQLPGGHTYIERPHWPNNALAEITVLDAGAGAAMHLRSGGKDWLFDCGSARDYETLLRDYLHSRGVNRLDGLLLTHGDSLHIGGAAALLEEFRPRRVLDNAAPDRSRIHRALAASLPQRQLLARGDHLQLARNLEAQILFPPRGFKAKAADDEALVVRLTIARRWRVLFVSDSGGPTEEALLRQPNELRSDVLVKGQHHSGESGSEEFLAAVQPQLIVASSVNFPARERISDEWAAAVRERGITLFRQDETGAVQLRFFDDRWSATGFVNQDTFRSSSR